MRITIACPGAVDTEIRDGRAVGPDAPGSMMSAERCAELILAAARRGRREIVMTAAGKLGAWLRAFFPGLVDAYVRRRVEAFYRI